MVRLHLLTSRTFGWLPCWVRHWGQARREVSVYPIATAVCHSSGAADPEEQVHIQEVVFGVGGPGHFRTRARRKTLSCEAPPPRRARLLQHGRIVGPQSEIIVVCSAHGFLCTWFIRLHHQLVFRPGALSIGSSPNCRSTKGCFAIGYTRNTCRCVGPRRAGHFGLRAQVEVTNGT
jgi:hypothetical protein